MGARRPRGKDFREVRHRGWRDFETVKRQAANAVTGLAFGLDLADREAARRLTDGDETPLGDAMGDEVPAALEFSFRPDDARQELQRAEQALAQMTVPFAIAIYNEYLVDVVQLYDLARSTTPPEAPASMQLGELHKYLADVHGVVVAGRQHELFELLVHLRNRIVHRGGRAGRRLVDLHSALSEDAHVAWERVAHARFPVPVAGEVVLLGRGEAKAALATADHHASALNASMQNDFDAAFWSDIAVRDFQGRHPAAWRHPLRRVDSVEGYVVRDYAVLELTRDDIEQAVSRAG